MGADYVSLKALRERLADIRSGPNRFEEETKFIMQAVKKGTNGRNSLDLAKPFFEDTINRYEEPIQCPAPFMLHPNI